MQFKTKIFESLFIKALRIRLDYISKATIKLKNFFTGLLNNLININEKLGFTVEDFWNCGYKNL